MCMRQSIWQVRLAVWCRHGGNITSSWTPPCLGHVQVFPSTWTLWLGNLHPLDWGSASLASSHSTYLVENRTGVRRKHSVHLWQSHNPLCSSIQMLVPHWKDAACILTSTTKIALTTLARAWALSEKLQFKLPPCTRVWTGPRGQCSASYKWPAFPINNSLWCNQSDVYKDATQTMTLFWNWLWTLPGGTKESELKHRGVHQSLWSSWECSRLFIIQEITGEGG